MITQLCGKDCAHYWNQIRCLKWSGEAADGREALALIKRRKPDVLIADLMMPGVNGLQLTTNVSRLKVKTRVIVLSIVPGRCGHVLEAFKNGAAGYVAKESGGAELFQAIEETLAGRHYLSPAISETSQNPYGLRVSTPGKAHTTSPDRFATLTARERVELRLVVEGASSRDVADRLKIGLRTVEARRVTLMRKLGGLKDLGGTDPLRAPSRGHAPVHVEDQAPRNLQQRRSSKVAAPAHRVRANIATQHRAARRQIAKIPTGIVGLDDVLRGGRPPDA